MTAYELTEAIYKLIQHRLLWNESETPEEAREHEQTIATIKNAIVLALEELKEGKIS